jgi:hypothetical protein
MYKVLSKFKHPYFPTVSCIHAECFCVVGLDMEISHFGCSCALRYICWSICRFYWSMIAYKTSKFYRVYFNKLLTVIV